MRLSGILRTILLILISFIKLLKNYYNFKKNAGLIMLIIRKRNALLHSKGFNT